MEIDQAWDRVQIVIVSPEFTIKTASYTLQFCFSCPSIFHSKEVWKRDHAINPIPRGGGMEMGPCNQSHSKEVWKWDHAANPIPGGGGMEMGPCSQSHSKGERYGNGTMQSIPFQGGEVWKWDHAASGSNYCAIHWHVKYLSKCSSSRENVCKVELLLRFQDQWSKGLCK